MVLSHVRQCFSLDSGSKELEPKENNRSLKRSCEESDEETDLKDILKKPKTNVTSSCPASNKGLTIKLKPAAAVSFITL